MRRLFLVATALSVALACGADTTANEPAAASQGSKGAAQDGTSALLSSYITVQETLADDSIDKLSELGAQIVAGSEGVQDKPGIADVMVGAGRIASQDIETARVGFEKMSMGLISYLKANPSERDGLQVIHCTMAFNNKGAYWVQNAGEVNNPYHGKMMLRCGDPIEWDKAPG